MWKPRAQRTGKPRFPYPWVGASLLTLALAGLGTGAVLRTPAAPPPIHPNPPSPEAPPPDRTPPPLPTPPDPPPSTCPVGCTVPQPGCVIKGNISKKGERIFHLPGQWYYDKTVISPEKGERWFCTEAEATANGWRQAKV